MYCSACRLTPRISYIMFSEAHNSSYGAMMLETTYSKKVSFHWIADSSSDWH